jgi:hypothetical protein
MGHMMGLYVMLKGSTVWHWMKRQSVYIGQNWVRRQKRDGEG